MLLILALGIFFTFGCAGLWQRLAIDIDGTVTARQDLPQISSSRGPTTRYVFKQSDGTIREYIATRYAPSLPMTIPIGAHVTKRNGETFYFVDGQRVEDFSVRVYVIALSVGIAFLIGAGFLLSRDRRLRGSVT